jgi:hypothetical protein
MRVHVPTPTYDTTPLVTVHTLVVELVTDDVPSPVVVTVGVNDPPTVPEFGRFDTITVGVARVTVSVPLTYEDGLYDVAVPPEQWVTYVPAG